MCLMVSNSAPGTGQAEVCCHTQLLSGFPAAGAIAPCWRGELLADCYLLLFNGRKCLCCLGKGWGRCGWFNQFSDWSWWGVCGCILKQSLSLWFPGFVLIALSIRQVELRAIFKHHQILFSALRWDQQPESLTSYTDVSCCSFSPWISVMWRGMWRAGYSLPIGNSSTCQKSIITSVVPPPPLQPHTSCFFYIENRTNSYFFYESVFLTSLICLQLVPPRFVAQIWTQY